MKDYQSFKRGELLIRASHITANYILPPVLSTFIDIHSNIQLNLNIESTTSIVQKILKKEIDLGVVSEQDLKDEQLSIHQLVWDDLMLIYFTTK